MVCHTAAAVTKWPPQGLRALGRYNGAIFRADFRLAPHVGVSNVDEDVETTLRSCVIPMA